MIATRAPIHEPLPGTYTCQWCGVRVTRGHTSTPKSCKDCAPTERAFEGKQ